MISMSTTGFSLALFPDITDNLKTTTDVKGVSSETITNNNNFILFSGEMPSATVLSGYTDLPSLKADYGDSIILEYNDFDIKYTFDLNTKTRKLEKYPIDALTFNSKIDGIAKWAVMDLTPKSLGIGDKMLIFTDSVGTWNDVDQSVLISDSTVIAGNPITVKSINITVQDVLLSDLI